MKSQYRINMEIYNKMIVSELKIKNKGGTVKMELIKK